DQWFLNLFPRKTPFTENSGGYLTLSFIPTLATMILGLIAGRWLQHTQFSSRNTSDEESSLSQKPASLNHSKLLLYLMGTGLVCIALGYALHAFGICPNVKRIWTPAWVLYSGGWCFLLLAFFVTIVDIYSIRWLFFPFYVFGVNSIAIYCLSHLIDGFIAKSLHTHLGKSLFQHFGTEYEPLLTGAGVFLVLWLVLYWMFRRKLFLKI
ncbi:MAG TPA: hypothetical protein PKA06_04275, partial [Gemmatales bacterium]|nr:hypothetical protein [Gemmatales bacterium]